MPPHFVAGRSEMISIQPRADVTRRFVRKRIVIDERERAGIVMQKFPDEMERPRILTWRSHGSEPNLPVNPRLIRRNEWRSPVRVARFCFEFVLLPLRAS